MSHLLRRRKKINSIKILLLVMFSAGFLYFLFQAGLRSIINSTVFIYSLTGKKGEANTEKTEDFYGILNLDEPESATSEATILVSGDASEFETVEYYINNVKVDTGKIKGSGTFAGEIGKLKSGENKIYVIAKTKDSKHEAKSDAYSVLYLNEKPKLEITSPKDGDSINQNEIPIQGATDKEVTIRINNQHVVVDVNGSFSSVVRLKEGENKIQITASDIAGNMEKKEITIKYEKEE